MDRYGSDLERKRVGAVPSLCVIDACELHYLFKFTDSQNSTPWKERKSEMPDRDYMQKTLFSRSKIPHVLSFILNCKIFVTLVSTYKSIIFTDQETMGVMKSY